MPLAPVTATKTLINVRNYGRSQRFLASFDQAWLRLAQKRNAACYDYKLVINEPVLKIGIVHQVSMFLTLSTGLVLLLGCQTGLQLPVAIRTEVLAPEIQIAP